MAQVHPEDPVTRLQEGQVHGHVGLGARVRLHVRVLRREELLRTSACKLLDLVHEFAPAVVTLAGKPLGVLVGEDGPSGFQDGPRNEVLGGNQLQLIGLSPDLAEDGGEDVGIRFFQMSVGLRHDAVASPDAWECR